MIKKNISLPFISIALFLSSCTAPYGGSADAPIMASGTEEISPSDQSKMDENRLNALENGKSGVTEKWYNAKGKQIGSITPQDIFIDKDQQTCREYQQTVMIAGNSQTSYGTACKQKEGSWNIIPF